MSDYSLSSDTKQALLPRIRDVERRILNEFDGYRGKREEFEKRWMEDVVAIARIALRQSSGGWDDEDSDIAKAIYNYGVIQCSFIDHITNCSECGSDDIELYPEEYECKACGEWLNC